MPQHPCRDFGVDALSRVLGLPKARPEGSQGDGSVHAWPARSTDMPRSMPSFFERLLVFAVVPVPKIKSDRRCKCSQPFSWISF